MWCVCHRSDLAMEDVEGNVDELTIWKTNLTGLSSYYRKSGTRTKALKRNGGSKEFPAHYEVRFAEHMLNLIKAAISNITSCRSHWKGITEKKGVDKKDKATAEGFLKTWRDDGMQMYLTSVKGDLVEIFQYLQKKCQKEEK